MTFSVCCEDVGSSACLLFASQTQWASKVVDGAFPLSFSSLLISTIMYYSVNYGAVIVLTGLESNPF